MTEIPSTYGTIYSGDNARAHLNDWFEKNLSRFSGVFFLVDENTHEHCLPLLLGDLPAINQYEILEIESGEHSKTIEVATQLWEALAELGADRKSLIVGLGGGVVTDMAGFIAATYMRGVAFLQIPTSLLAMVDASVGGKTGVDVGGIKNLVGTFSEAQGIWVDPVFLDTLDERQLMNGFAEMLKHGLIHDDKYFVDLLGVDSLDDTFYHMITRSIRIKGEIVDADSQEAGLRRILNFGHSIGHAIEAYALANEFDVLHGEAIAVGMWCESYMLKKQGLLSEVDFEIISKNIDDRYQLPASLFSEIEGIISYLKFDKKNTGGELKASGIRGIGKPIEEFKYNLDQAGQAIFAYANR